MLSKSRAPNQALYIVNINTATIDDCSASRHVLLLVDKMGVQWDAVSDAKQTTYADIIHQIHTERALP